MPLGSGGHLTTLSLATQKSICDDSQHNDLMRSVLGSGFGRISVEGRIRADSGGFCSGALLVYLCEALRGPRWGFRQSRQLIRPSGAHMYGAPLRRSGGGCGLLAGTSAHIRLGWAPRRRSDGGCGYRT